MSINQSIHSWKTAEALIKISATVITVVSVINHFKASSVKKISFSIFHQWTDSNANQMHGRVDVIFFIMQCLL